MSLSTTVVWLKFASGLVIAMGLLTATGAQPALAGVLRFIADLLFWPLDGAQTLAQPESRLLAAVGGGVMTGWGILLWLVVTRLFAREPQLARTMILAAMIGWFVVDSTGSVLAGAPLNAMLNLGFLLLFVIPLWRPAKAGMFMSG